MNKDKVKSQSFTVITTFILVSIVRSIIGYIALSIIVPIWNWFWKKKT
jgi:hypothetical protein